MKTILTILVMTIIGSLTFTLLPGMAVGAESTPPHHAVAVLHPTAGSNVSGTIHFTAVADGVKVSATVEGLKPGKHGFHIHELGDCSAPDGTSAGGHFNPEKNPHAGPDQAKRHVGDLGNLFADGSDRSHYERVDSHLSLNGAHSIVGRAVIVHAGEDDLTSQPTGAAGGRLACGVIGVTVR
ncbi:SodC: superoxide dismutase [Desulfosarcina variabilis str. Montpellier]|uniref:superoxide dismutase family protein n=1 Tax=Desulfosarcina variabilis TaxID=2300 RepID=UPI003AFB2941